MHGFGQAFFYNVNNKLLGSLDVAESVFLSSVSSRADIETNHSWFNSYDAKALKGARLNILWRLTVDTQAIGRGNTTLTSK